MSAEYATFGLAPAMRAGGVLANGDYQVHRDFVDFIVDGRPLLFQLSDLDAVSPLASDVPPAIFTAQVRSLLLEADAPLAGGRYVIYGCPECADLACGAVTAVIERDGDGLRLARLRLADGRARRPGAERLPRASGRSASTAPSTAARCGPCCAAAAEPAARRRVLLIGARVAVLAKLAAALRTIGIGADITARRHRRPRRRTARLRRRRLRPGRQRGGTRRRTAGLRPRGRRGRVRRRPRPDHPAPRRPDRTRPGPQPARTAPPDPAGRRRRRGGRRGHLHLPGRLTAYRLDRLYRTHTHEVFDGILEAGRHRIALDAKAVKGESFIVARTSGSVLVEPMAR